MATYRHGLDLQQEPHNLHEDAGLRHRRRLLARWLRGAFGRLRVFGLSGNQAGAARVGLGTGPREVLGTAEATCCKVE